MPLTLGMRGIRNGHFERIAEHRGCLDEIDCALLKVYCRLVWYHSNSTARICRSSVQIGITCGFSRGGSFSRQPRDRLQADL